MSEVTAATPVRLRSRLAPRARFRRRLDRDPRRWVLALVAAEGLVALPYALQDRRAFFYGEGYGVLVLVAFLAIWPAVAVVTALVHGRLLFWTGKLLGGRARPLELHAALAWSQAPFVLVAWPLLLEIPLRAAAADRDPVPGPLQLAIDLLSGIARPATLVASVAALAGATLWVAFVAEAQRFTAWRAIANQVLAALVALALVVAGVLAAERVTHDRWPVVLLSMPVAGALFLAGLAVERAVTSRAAGRRAPATPGDPSAPPEAAP